MSEVGQALTVLAIGYLIGSIPFGILLTRFAGAGDLRDIGSGSTGATNVLRTGRKDLAAATLVLDLLKGAAAVLLAQRLVPGWPGHAAFGAVVGHCYPLWLRFQGGKGVATLMGVATALAWSVGAVFAVVWLGVLAIFRISSLGGICAAISAPLAALAFAPQHAAVLAALALLVVWRHRTNIGRLIRREEPRIGAK